MNFPLIQSRDDREDICQMSTSICEFVLEKFGDNDKFICLNALTNAVYVILSEFDIGLSEKEMVYKFCEVITLMSEV